MSKACGVVSRATSISSTNPQRPAGDDQAGQQHREFDPFGQAQHHQGSLFDRHPARAWLGIRRTALARALPARFVSRHLSVIRSVAVGQFASQAISRARGSHHDRPSPPRHEISAPACSRRTTARPQPDRQSAPWARSSPRASRAAASCKGSLAVSAIAATVSPLALITADKARAAGASAFTFDEVEAGIDDKHHVAAGYDADVLLRWGDPLFADAPEFDPTEADGRGPGQAVRLQQRLCRLYPDRRLGRARPAGRQPRIHQPASDVPGHRHDRREGRQEGDRGRAADQGAGRRRDGRAWRHHRRDPQGRRQVAGGARRQAQPPHHRHHRNGAHRPGRRP